MKWPWQSNLETRADSSYTDALVAAITANAKGQTTAFPSAVGALEAAAGLVGRAFASAVVETESSAVMQSLTPGCLALIGRSLIRRGEIVFYIDTSMGMIDLLPCQSHDVDGAPNPATWLYRCTVSGPDMTHTYERTAAAGVVHITYSVDTETPWRGRGPLQSAQLTGRLAAEVLAALADESSGPRGHLLGIPVDGNDPTVTNLRQDLRNLAGKIALIETGVWGGAPGGGQFMLKPERLGPEPTAALVELFKISREDVLSACGINPSLVMDAQGTAQREAYRQFLFGTVAPLGRMVAAELSEKLGAPIKLDWEELRASDIAGRARAFGTMVSTGGMDVDRAAALSGLLSAE